MFTPEDIISIQTRKEFHKIAMKVYRYQYEHNLVYREFCDLIQKTPTEVRSLDQVPFLPIEFFKSKNILSSTAEIQTTFTSSGTTGSITSKHHVTDLNYYEESFRKGFTYFYGPIEEYVVLALLPSYLEREGSSLIYMADDFIQQSNHPESGFYLHNYEELIAKLERLDREGKNVLLLGVTYALLDIIEQHQFTLKNTIIMETGGMKGKRKEMIREELHHILCQGFGVHKIHSEYGMTELLSQGYSLGDGIFQCPPWMDIVIRDPEDPFTRIETFGKTGGVNVIDLANINSCSFIATQDLGKKYEDGSFEILGRFDHSDIRGCNLMVL
ncbi:acyl transferase [Myroides sp. DW712]|uniref:LuxE/PaaK family acyltransferase n=1 Tax=Myroides sp. DW712 TaxID=3389800 RepID=UPI00397A6A3D